MLRFTLFNSITLFIMALTIAMMVARLRLPVTTNWAILYYLIIAGFWRGFDGSLNTKLVLAGFILAALLRFAPLAGAWLTACRVAEFAVLLYILARGLGLLLLRPDWF